MTVGTGHTPLRQIDLDFHNSGHVGKIGSDFESEDVVRAAIADGMTSTVAFATYGVL